MECGVKKASSMKVLHVIPAIASRYGGPSKAVIGMARALLEHGVDVLVATTDADGIGRLHVPIGEQTSYEGVNTIFFPRQWSEAFKYSRPLAKWLREHVRDHDIVHIHAVFSHSSLAAARACRLRGVSYVVRPLGSLHPWSLTQRGFSKRIFWHAVVKRMLMAAHAIHYTTIEEKRLAHESLKLQNGSGVVIPLGVDEGLLENANSESRIPRQLSRLGKAPYILFLSRLHPKKGIELLLEAFLKVTAKEPFKNWHLVLAGEGDPLYIGKLKLMVRQLNGDARVSFAGWLEGSDKIHAMKGAELLVLPSFQENFALSVVEAMACGVPALVSEHVNLASEIIQAGAGWVAPLETEEMVQVLKEAMKNKEERKFRGAKGKRLVRTHFTWQIVAGKLIEMYRELSSYQGYSN